MTDRALRRDERACRAGDLDACQRLRNAQRRLDRTPRVYLSGNSDEGWRVSLIKFWPGDEPDVDWIRTGSWPRGRRDSADTVVGRIASSDYAFAWLDPPLSLSSLIEIGFAIAQGTPVFLATSDSRVAEECWFAGELAINERHVYPDLETAWREFRSLWTGGAT